MSADQTEPQISVARLQRRIGELRLNPYSTAKKAGLGGSYVRDILRGKVKQPSAARLSKLAAALDVPTAWLMGVGPEVVGEKNGDQLGWAGGASATGIQGVLEDGRLSDARFLFSSLLDVLFALDLPIASALKHADETDLEGLFASNSRLPYPTLVFLAHAVGVIDAAQRDKLLVMATLTAAMIHQADVPEDWRFGDPLFRDELAQILGEENMNASPERLRTQFGAATTALALAFTEDERHSAKLGAVAGRRRLTREDIRGVDRTPVD